MISVLGMSVVVDCGPTEAVKAAPAGDVVAGAVLADAAVAAVAGRRADKAAEEADAAVVPAGTDAEALPTL